MYWPNSANLDRAIMEAGSINRVGGVLAGALYRIPSRCLYRMLRYVRVTNGLRRSPCAAGFAGDVPRWMSRNASAGTSGAAQLAAVGWIIRKNRHE